MKFAYIVETEDFLLIYLHEHPLRGLQPGYYLKNNKGYWYRVEVEWAVFNRIKYVGLVKALDKMIGEDDGE